VPSLIIYFLELRYSQGEKGSSAAWEASSQLATIGLMKCRRYSVESFVARLSGNKRAKFVVHLSIVVFFPCLCGTCICSHFVAGVVASRRMLFLFLGVAMHGRRHVPARHSGGVRSSVFVTRSGSAPCFRYTLPYPRIVD
jgi:hypothetical protein